MGLWGVTSTAALSANSFTLIKQPVNGDKLVIGDLTYTFVDTLSTGPAINGEILIGASIDATRDNINDAVTDDAGASTNQNSTYGFVAGSDHSPHQWDGTTQTVNSTATNSTVDATDGGTVTSLDFETVNGQPQITINGGGAWDVKPNEKVTITGTASNNSTFTVKGTAREGTDPIPANDPQNILFVDEAVTQELAVSPTLVEKGFKVAFTGNTGTGREIDNINVSVISNENEKFGFWEYPSFKGGIDIDESKPKNLTDEEKNSVFASFQGWEKATIKTAALQTGKITAIPVDAETVIVAGQTYTFKDTLGSADDVKIATGTPTNAGETNYIFDISSSSIALDGTGKWLGKAGDMMVITGTGGATNDDSYTINSISFDGKTATVTPAPDADETIVTGSVTNTMKVYESTHQNLINAINRTGTAGTDYHTDTDANDNVTADQQHLVASGELPIRLVARVAGADGNAVALSNAGTSTYVFDSLFLEGGQDFRRGTRGTSKLSFSANPLNTETVTISHFDTGNKVYTFQTTLTDSDGNVQIGTDAAESAANLAAAINLGAGSGTAYAASMTQNKSVSASKSYGEDAVVVRSLINGERGNVAIATTVTGATLSNPTLVGGSVDNELLIAVQLQSINLGTANLVDIIINAPSDNAYSEAESDEIIATLVYNEPVVWVDGGADPTITVQLDGTDAAVSRTLTIDPRHSGKASHRLDFKYTVVADGVHAFSKLNITGQPNDLSTVTLGAVTYRIIDTMAQADDVQRGVDQATTTANLIAAINGTGTAGTEWFTGTTHQTGIVTAVENAGDIDVTAVKSGTAPNSLTTTDPVDVGGVLAWEDTTLGGGTGASVAGTAGDRADAGEFTLDASSITLGGGTFYDVGRDGVTNLVTSGDITDIDFTQSTKLISIQSAGTWTVKQGDKVRIFNTTTNTNDGTFTVASLSSNLKDITVVEALGGDQTAEDLSAAGELTTPTVAVNDFTASGQDGTVDLQAAFDTKYATIKVNA